MKKTIILIFIIYLAISCSQKENRPRAIKDITFPIGSKIRSKFIGVVQSKGNIDKFIYFADPISNKTIKLFNFKGQLIDSIPLKEALDYLGAIDGIAFISKDSIIINSEYTNKIITINSKGKCWHIPVVDNLKKDKNNNVYEIIGSANSGIIDNSNIIIFNISFLHNLDDRLNNIEPIDNLEWAKYFYNKSYQSPYFLKISDYFSDAPKLEFAFHDFYKRVSQTPRVLNSLPYYKATQKYIVVFSKFSDKLFILNSTTLEFIKEVKISSDYTHIGNPSQPLNEEGLSHLEELNNRNAKTKGRINDMFYNPQEKKYYLVVLHDVLDEKEKRKQYPTRQFSVIVYDNQFENPKEYAFTDEAYKHYPCLMSSQGLLLAKIPPKSKTNDQITFTLFKF